MNQEALSKLRPEGFRKLVTWLGVPRRHADDVSQDAFLRFWEKISQLDPSRDMLPFLRGFITREALSYRRRSDSRREVLTPFDELDPGDTRPGPEDDAIARERYEKVLSAIEQLDGKVKAVMIAHVLEGKPLAVVAATLGIAEKTAEKRLALARSALQAGMKRWQAEPRRSREHARGSLLFPLVDLDERRWFRGLLHATARPVASAALASLLGGILIPAGPTSPPPHTPASRLSSAVSSAVASLQPGVKRVEAPAPFELAESARAALPAASGAKTGRGEIGRPSHDLEASLIMRATSLIEVGSPEALVEALRLLKEHFDRYQNGRLAAQREALLRRIR